MLTEQDSKILSKAAEKNLPSFTAAVREWYIKKKLTEHKGNIADASEAMGITRWALYSAMKTLSIKQ